MMDQLIQLSEVLEEYSRKDARIKISFRDTSGHISEASNTAANLASGDFIAMLDHDDKLREHSLLLIVKLLKKMRMLPCYIQMRTK